MANNIKSALGVFKILMALAILSLTSCGGSSNSEEQGTITNAPAITEPSDPTGPSNPIPDMMIMVDGVSYNDIKQAELAIRTNSVVTFGDGVYTQGMTISQNNVTLRGSTNTHFKGAQVQGKATFVIAGDNIVIENIECSQVSVPDQNGACVRQEGRDLQLKSVYFHDSEQGILSGSGTGTLLIEYSTFDRLGKIGRAHAVYSANDKLEIRYSKFYSSKDEGHEIKSRAKETVIEYSEIASLGGDDSRLVDISDGGVLVIRGSVLEQGPNTSNRQLIGYGLESLDSSIVNSVILEDNIVLLDRQSDNELLSLPANGADVSISGNDFVGSMIDSEGLDTQNTFYSDRATFGLASYPELPDIGLN